MRRLFKARLVSNVTGLFAILVLSVAPFMTLGAHSSAQSEGTWAHTGSLSIQRPGSTVTLLQDGDVLVAGGGEYAPLNSAELYDPTTGVWTLTGSMNVGRFNASATLLQDGDVLVAGGQSVDGLDNTAELYNPSTGSWSYTGSLNVGRYIQTATLLQDGDVLVAGGAAANDGLITGSAEIYNPSTGVWTITGSMGVGRYDSTITLLPDGDVLTAGGEDSSFHILTDAELYNPSTGMWSETGGMTTPRAQHTATLLHNGKVLVAGGGNTSASYNTSSELYDPATGIWTPTGSMHKGRVAHTATLLSDGEVLVAGSEYTNANSAELYDPATGIWTPTGSMNDDRYSFTAVLLQNGDVLVAGGYGDNLDTTRAAELYTPSPINIPPTITYSLSSAPNSAGWNNGPVTVTFNCADNSGSGLASCSSSVTLSADGANQTVTGTALDNNGNSSSVTAIVNIDQTPPSVGTPTWSTNPSPVGQSATLYVPTSDSLSGVVGGEYYIGNTDPGQGNGTPMFYSNGQLFAYVGSNLGVGVYNISTRSKDAAGNWSPVTSTMLVVYDPSTSLGITGKNKKDLVPSLANGDVMPGLTSSNQTDAADYGMTVQYVNGALDPSNAFHFNYSTGTHCHGNNAVNCHSFALASTSFSWLVINGTNNSQGQFEGTASVTVDGVTTTNPFTVSATDGNALTPVANDYLILKVYSPGADPSTATPIYQASGSMPSGNGVVIK